MRIEDIGNRFLLMNAEMAQKVTFTYDGSGMIIKEVREVSTESGVKSVTKLITITYTRDGDGNITEKTVAITTLT